MQTHDDDGRIHVDHDQQKNWSTKSSIKPLGCSDKQRLLNEASKKTSTIGVMQIQIGIFF